MHSDPKPRLGGSQLTLQHRPGLGGCDAEQATDTRGWCAGGEAAAIRALIAQGLGNSEACRVVGIDRKTGNRWRYGRKVRNSAGALVIYPPVKIIESRPRSPRYLSEQERIRIADLLAAKVSVRGIAEELGPAPSTISREIRRNRDPDGRYRPHHAEHAARCRACRPRTRRIAGDEVLGEAVQRLLSKRWSPEQVAHELRVLFADQPLRWLCKETIGGINRSSQRWLGEMIADTRPAPRRVSSSRVSFEGGC